MNTSKYYVEESWVGPHDDEPTCLHQRCVGCASQTKCDTCGWNPFVSMLRIKERFGEEYIRSLSCTRK